MKLKGLTKAYGETAVLAGFSLELPKTGIIGFFGPSGCGKTTLFSLMAGLIPPDAGEILERPSPISCVFQEDRLLPWSTALDNVRKGAGVTKEQAGAILADVGLQEALYKYPGELSGGMGRRAAIARALVFPAPLLLMDEPFSNIDQTNKENLYEILKKRKNSQLICIISHDKEELNRLCSHVVEMEGPPLTILAKNKI